MKVPFRILPLVISLSAIGLTGCLSGGGGGGGSSDAPAPPPSTSTPTNPTVPTLPPASEPAQITSVVSLSNDPILVSDGNVLVEVQAANISEAAADILVLLNGQAVTNKFAIRSGNRFVGLVSGLKNGENTITASSQANPSSSAQLLVKNHPASGPIFSGPHLQPYVCARPLGTKGTFSITNPSNGQSAETNAYDSGLGGMPDAHCNIQREVSYFYQPTSAEPGCALNNWSENACLIPFDTSNPPLDSNVARFTNDRGDTVRFILAIERGTLNRGMYSLSVLHDPELPHHPAQPQRGWNNKLIFSFGTREGVAGNRYQASPYVLFFNEKALRAGYMLANSTLNDDRRASHTVGAEAVMMLKEHIVETYGPIRYTVGSGGEEAAAVQLSMASAYPGLLSGLITALTHADTLTSDIESYDCGLFRSDNGYLGWFSYFERDAMTLPFSGHTSPYHCDRQYRLRLTNPTVAANCGPQFPESLVYHPTDNPSGVRCSYQEHNVNLLGSSTSADGVTRANQPLDNEGVQYGLLALQNGSMSVERFIDINEKIGFYDLDQNRIPGLKRGAGSLEAIERAYRAGMVTDGRYLANVPIIDLRYNDRDQRDQNLNWRVLALRERLVNANGHHDNQLILAYDQPSLTVQYETAFEMMDEWLASIEANTSSASLAEKIVESKPESFVDQCFFEDSVGNVRGTNLDSADCPVKFGMSPRQVAGGPVAEDILKCQLKPLNLDSSDYQLSLTGDQIIFTLDQQSRLQAVFASGVCDWSKPGVAQQLNPGWMSFADGPDGVPLDLTWFERP